MPALIGRVIEDAAVTGYRPGGAADRQEAFEIDALQYPGVDQSSLAGEHGSATRLGLDGLPYNSHSLYQLA